MIENFHEQVQEIPDSLCERCGERCENQELTLTLVRPKLTRVTKFCSMICMRKWAAPIR